MIAVGSGTEFIATIREAPRALVFISVPWSMPERLSRQTFELAIAQLKTDLIYRSVAGFRLEVDEDAAAQQWLASLGLQDWAINGAGGLLWVAAGKVVNQVSSAHSAGVAKIVAQTRALWPE